MSSEKRSSERQRRVLFVCLGNICRSPMAHAILAHKVRERGWAQRYGVDSCGTGAYHVGESPDPRTLEVLQRHGIRFEDSARALCSADVDRFDHILVMDVQNLRDARRIVGSDAPELVLALTGAGSVPDPYYGGPGGFDHVYNLLDEALDAWLERWEAQG